MKIEIKTINEKIADDEPAQILLCLDGQLISRRIIGLEIVDEEITLDDPFQISIFLDDKLISKIIIEIEEQEGADSIPYPAITLKEIRVWLITYQFEFYRAA